jgi:type I restriction enzyme S subunit
VWTRINDICSIIVDCPHSTPKWTDKGIYCLRTSDVKLGYIDLSNCRYVSEDSYQERIIRLEPKYGDIVYTREGTLGNAAVVPETVKLCLGQRLMLLRPGNPVDSQYVVNCLIAPLIFEAIIQTTKGSTSKHINVGDVKKYMIPLPPLSEQHRIVERVDTLMALCDELEERVSAKEDAAERLLASVCDGICG